MEFIVPHFHFKIMFTQAYEGIKFIELVDFNRHDQMTNKNHVSTINWKRQATLFDRNLQIGTQEAKLEEMNTIFKY